MEREVEEEGAFAVHRVEALGFRAAELIPLGWIWTTPGFTDEKIWLYRATDLTATEQDLQGDEVLEVVGPFADLGVTWLEEPLVLDDVERILWDGNNGMYTNDWPIADIKTGEVAILLLGTHTKKMWRTTEDVAPSTGWVMNGEAATLMPWHLIRQTFLMTSQR